MYMPNDPILKTDKEKIGKAAEGKRIFKEDEHPTLEEVEQRKRWLLNCQATIHL